MILFLYNINILFTNSKEHHMINTSLSNFLNNTEAFISNSANNNEPVTIKSDDCNLVIISEKEYERLVE